MYGSVELGGTKIRCAVMDELGNIEKEIRINTTDPRENIRELIEFFKENPVEAMGIGAFGPVDVDEKSDTYGYVLKTPKVLWQNFDLLGSIKKASGMGEYIYGASKDKQTSMYITIGTGVGASFIQDGVLLEGLSHPEMGHIELVREDGDDTESYCPNHKS